MKWFKRLLTEVVRQEVRAALMDKNYLKQVKASMRDDIEAIRQESNDSYLTELRK